MPFTMRTASPHQKTAWRARVAAQAAVPEHQGFLEQSRARWEVTGKGRPSTIGLFYFKTIRQYQQILSISLNPPSLF